jgi:hypothetical protein
MLLVMKTGHEQLSFLERARRRLDLEWRDQLSSAAPDWWRLFEIHFALAALERRLRRCGRAL